MTEVEIKLAVGPAESQIRLLVDLKVELIHRRGYEENVLLDLPGLPLRARGGILRVRDFDGTSTVTYKEPAPGLDGYKVRREIETSVGNAGLVLQILESAGFHRVWKYAKFRTIYRDGPLFVLLDETPIGNYLELEGPREAIDAFAKRLGRSPSEYITSTYRTLHEDWCRKRGVPAGDLMFERDVPS